MVSVTEPAALELGDDRAFQDPNSLNSRRDKLMLLFQAGTHTQGVMTMASRQGFHYVECGKKTHHEHFNWALQKSNLQGTMAPLGWVGFPVSPIL